MSRIGNRVLEVPTGISIDIQKDKAIIKSNTEQLVVMYPENKIALEQKDNHLKVIRKDDTQESNMFQGTVNANLSNALIGLTKGFSKHLELKGVGYRAKVEGSKIVIGLGFSHPVNIEIPHGIKIEQPSQTEIIINGFDKAVVGQLAADIRSYRKPEPYKGKGVLYKGEQIVRKVGKTADKKK